MASYIESTLGKGETILRTARVSLWSLSPLILVGVLTIPIVLGLFVLAAVYVRYKSTELAVTNRRVVVKFGFISRRTLEISIAKIESVRVEQGIIGRMFDFGSLTIAGTGSTHEPLQGIADPLGFRRACMDAQAGETTPARAAEFVPGPE